MPGAIAALMYDFDKTLSPKDMQEYAFIQETGLTPAEFWRRCDDMKLVMDPILGYMLVMLQEAEGKMLLTRGVFNRLGAGVDLFPGVESWFSRVNEYARTKNITLEHYIISSGLKEIIEGTSIAREFKEIYAAEFYYNERGVPFWPAMAVNYTSKTQFLFRINKGALDANDHVKINEYTPKEARRIPFENMVYFGDGYTDVPSMRIVTDEGGCSIAVYGDANKSVAQKLLLDGRVCYALRADYSKGSPLEGAVFGVLDKIAAQHKAKTLHDKNMQKASGDLIERGAL